MEVMLRNGEVVTGPMRQHWFGHLPNEPRAEIIGWRVTQQAPKPLMALDAEESEGLHISTDAIKTASAQILGRIESFCRELVDENQRLKNQLADAQATLKAANAEFGHRMRREQETIESMTKRLVELESYAPKRIQRPDGTIAQGQLRREENHE
jgi:hypothetical protein